ncbi:MAG TPA: hypothetical protein VIH35_05560, partial [Kiritimatiellia bacterium]
MDDPIFDANAQSNLYAALACINMTPSDLGFAKDHGEPAVVLNWTRAALGDPLLLCKGAVGILHSLSAERSTKVWELAAALLEVPAPKANGEDPGQLSTDMWEGLDPVLAESLARFMVEARKANALLDRAYAKLSYDNQSYLAASFLGGSLDAEDREDIRKGLYDLGATSNDILRAVAEGNALDPRPAATNYLALAGAIDLAALLEAGEVFQQAVKQVFSDTARVQQWPQGNLTVVTDLGQVRIASKEDDTYVDKALLVIEPGGHNVYRGYSGVANGLDRRKRQRLSAIIDLAGRDQYRASSILSPGSALFGISVIIDADGDDVYNAAWIGQGVGLFGVGWVDDRGGSDSYQAFALAQGAATYGLGYLRDRKGNDAYGVGFQGQAFAATMGVGLLVDEDGSDRYFAGGREPDHERNDDRYLSLAQGFSIGMRPYAGGGVAALVDFAGNDTYVADIFGQGASYWYSAGFLLDR